MKKIFIFFSVVIIAVVLFLSPFLIKVKVSCTSQYGACPKQILDKISVFNGKSLFTARKGIKKILGSEFLVSDYSLQFKIPNNLHAELLIKKAVTVFKNSTSGSSIFVDKDGKVLSEATDSALPIVTLDKELPKTGEVISNSNLFVLNLALGIYQMYQVRESSVQEESLLVELPGQIRVIFPLDGDSAALLGSLRLIYSKIKENGNLAGYSQIDLRYRNPVLR